MIETIDFIKKLWENKRTRSLSILIIYFIFFLFVFSIISPSNKSVNNPNNNQTDNNTTDSGIISTDKFYYLNDIEIINYYAYDNANNTIENYDTRLISGSVIYILVKNSILESTNYINNSNTYYINSKDYEKIINNIEVETDNDIRIIVSNNNIILDFSDYYGYKINIDIRS